jgi:hypothetical protein
LSAAAGAYRIAVGAFHVVAENNFGDTRSGSLAGPLGLLIILLLAIATFLLIRNMNSRLKRLPESFPDPEQPDPARPDPARSDPAGTDPVVRDPDRDRHRGGTGAASP